MNKLSIKGARGKENTTGREYEHWRERETLELISLYFDRMAGFFVKV